MMSTGARILLPLAVVSLAACGETSIQLTVDKREITAGGIDHATITARALLQGDAVPRGTAIEFTTTAGSFAPAEELQETSAATENNGEATVKLYSGQNQGQATVTASFSDDESGAEAQSSVTITFGPPTASQRPVDGTFRMTCDAVNIGALREPVPEIKVRCSVTAQTRKGETLPAAALALEFRTEAGTITPATDPQTGERSFLYSAKGGASAPRDVTPDPALNEPSTADQNGRTRNPRDGLATLIAVTLGEEAFADSNGNGQYDQGEPFADAAEPFVDLDDNDRWDVGEPFVDSNGNDAWDAANGHWDDKLQIMAVYKLLWTGPLHASNKTSRIERLGNAAISDGGKLELEAHVLDANLNPVAAFAENQDYLEWTISSSGDAQTNDATDPPLTNALGFSFDKSANTERQRWLIVSNSFAPKPFRLTLEDGYPADGETDPLGFTVSAAITASPGPAGDGTFLSQLGEVFPDRVQGTCD